MPINASHEYYEAEKNYLQAQTLEDKIYCLEELIKVAPKHKSSENLLAELKTRLKKLKQKQEKSKKAGPTKKGIKKEGYQFVLLGLPNSGKSSLLEKLTNTNPKISEVPFTTQTPKVGTFQYKQIQAQIIDLPSIGSPNLDQSIINTADCLLLVTESIKDLEKITPYLKKSKAKILIVITKSDLLSSDELRKLVEQVKSKKLEGAIVSAITEQGIDVLKQLLFQQMEIVRVYTKLPHQEKTKEPIILAKGSTVKDAAEKILKGLSQKIKETRVTGPSSKFPNQKVGLTHILKDLDIIEFHTK